MFSLNANGLGDKVKRQAVFDKLKKKGPAIYLLQETHSSVATMHAFYTSWGNKKIIFSHGTTASKGVAILFSENFEYKIEKEIIDLDGRFIIIDIQIDRKIYTIANLYAPTRMFRKDQIKVLNDFCSYLNTFKQENTIVGGDFNLYLNPKLDKLDNMSDTGDNPEYRNNLVSYLETNDLIDLWRTLNPNKRVFTWKRGNSRSRLDYFFTSDHLLNTVNDVTILPGFHSDHSLLCVSFNDNMDEKPGRGFWKFNTSLLHDTEYVKTIKSIIAQSVEKHKHIEDKRLLWELVKLEVRNFTVPYSVKKKKTSMEFEQNLGKRLEQLNATIQSDSVNEDIMLEFETTKNELEQIEKHKARGVILRSKCKWVEEGEHNTSYFLRLEKHNYSNKLISRLEVGGKTITDSKEILKAEKLFYENLYTQNEIEYETFKTNSDTFTNNSSIPKISDTDKIFCESELTEAEVLKSLKEPKNGKSPGSDGLSAEWYKFFWQDIKSTFMSSLRFSIKMGELSIEQKRGIITLIPKKDKNRLYLKNWRPITLLNADYKILAKIFANRLCKVLPYIINEDQTGYIKGRFIGCNIRQIEDAFLYCNMYNKPGIILTIDFEKAFDSINWKFVEKSLYSFNFGPSFCNVIKMLYKDISSCIVNNGRTSEWFQPTRGVRQGCPISPYIFIIAVELLAISIRENKNIRGIEINGSIMKLSQLADDTTCFVADIDSIREILLLFNKYEKCAGLKMNLDKTKATFIGSFKERVDAPLGLDWSEKNIHSLGITLSGNEIDHYELNYKARIQNMKNLLNTWKCRKLSLKGKVTVINNLALSPLLYVCSVIHTPDIVIEQVKKLILDFMWDGKPSKIAYNVIIQDISLGGLKLTDFESKVKSLKACWVKRFLDTSTSRWKAAPCKFYDTSSVEMFFKENHGNYKISPKFYEDVHNFWSEIRTINKSNLSKNIIKSQIIWKNRYITSGIKPKNKKTLHWKEWIKNGILTIDDILKDDNKFMSEFEIQKIFNIKCTYLDIYQIRGCIPSEWKNVITKSNEQNKKDNVIEKDIFICNSMYCVDTICTKPIYEYFTRQKAKEPTCIKKWTEMYPGFKTAVNDIWENIFRISFKITRETKLQTFQYKIIHRLIACRKKLFDWKIVDHPTCLFCSELDDLRHFFLLCVKTDQFWNSFFAWWNNLGDIEISPEFDCLEENILFGFQIEGEVFSVLNYCILLAKHHIYSKNT
jgi:exonuclease III